MPEATPIELERMLARRRQPIGMLVAQKSRLSGLIDPRKMARVVGSIERALKTIEEELDKGLVPRARKARMDTGHRAR